MAVNSFSKFVLENWRISLKLATLGISGTLGMIAMLNDFKDKNGQLTRWGKVNLSGLLVAFLVGVVLEVADTQEQNRKARAAEAAANEQVRQSTLTNKNLIAVLQTSLQVQAGVGNTLKQQSKILGANQRTFREVERGFTPLGSQVVVTYQLALPDNDQRFTALQSLLNTEIDKFTAQMAAANSFPYRQAVFPSSLDGLRIQANILQKKVTGAELSFDAPVLQGLGGWPSQVMTGPPFHVKVWKRRPIVSRCTVTVDPDVEFALDPMPTRAVDAQPRKQDDLEGSTAIRDVSNRYDVATRTLTQTGSVRLAQRLGDDGVIQSPLDLEGALVDVMMALALSRGRMPDEPGASFKFRELTIYAGHYTIRLDPEHPAERCGSDIYFVLPAHLPAPR